MAKLKDVVNYYKDLDIIRVDLEFIKSKIIKMESRIDNVLKGSRKIIPFNRLSEFLEKLRVVEKRINDIQKLIKEK